MKIVESIKHLNMTSFTLYTMGNAHMQLHQYKEAVSFFNQANELAERTGNAWILGAVACGFAEICLARQELDAALNHYRHAMRYADQVESPDKKTIVLRGMSEIFWQRGQLKEALKYSHQALGMKSSPEGREETLFAAAYILTDMQTISVVRIKRVIKELLLDEKERAKFLVLLSKLLRNRRPNLIMRIGEILEDIEVPFPIDQLYKSQQYRRKYAHLDTVGKMLAAVLLQTVDMPPSTRTRITHFLIKSGYWPREVDTSDVIRYTSTKRWGGGGGCFPAGTQIHLCNGTASIETLNIDDVVLCCDHEGGELAASAIQHVYYGCAEEYYIINDGLRVTATHFLYTNRGWLGANQIRLGDFLYDTHHDKVLVESIRIVKDNVDVYNFSLKETHTFFADGVLVHNPHRWAKF